MYLRGNCLFSGQSSKRLPKSPLQSLVTPIRLIRCMRETEKTVLLGLTLQELTGLAERLGQPAYRGRQLYEALYSQRIESAGQISTLPQEFRSRLTDDGFSVGLPKIEKEFASAD